MTYLIKRDGKTVIKTLFAKTAAQYRGKDGYKVIQVPVSR